MPTRCVFVTGATGYLGRALIPRLCARGHTVRALVRSGSADKLPAGCTPIIGQALDPGTYGAHVAPADTFVHLVGTPRPNPWKAAEFERVDLASVHAALAAAKRAGVGHFVYVSVAQPAPVMRAYLEARAEAERRIRASGLNATIVRPWYVLGPGHRWPLVFVPVYALLEWLPATRAAAQRLGLVRLSEMRETLVHAVEHPPDGLWVIEVPEIRRLAQTPG